MPVFTLLSPVKMAPVKNAYCFCWELCFKISTAEAVHNVIVT